VRPASCHPSRAGQVQRRCPIRLQQHPKQFSRCSSLIVSEVSAYSRKELQFCIAAAHATSPVCEETTMSGPRLAISKLRRLAALHVVDRPPSISLLAKILRVSRSTIGGISVALKTVGTPLKTLLFSVQNKCTFCSASISGHEAKRTVR